MSLSTNNHGVVVIHGIYNNEKPGGLVATVANSIADSLMESPHITETGLEKHPVIERGAHIDGNPPTVTLKITAPDDKKSTWTFKEAFWGDAFPPPAAAKVLRWIVRQQVKHFLRYFMKGFGIDPANNRSFKAKDDVSLEKSKWNTGPLLSKVYRVEIWIMGAVLTILLPIVPIILFLLWPLHWLPKFDAFATFHTWVHSLDPVLSNILGDVQRYIEHGVWSANARNRLESIIIEMLNDKNIDDLTIIAHSLGAVVTYDALSEGGKIAQEVRSLKNKKINKKITFISVGSGINLVFQLARSSNNYAQRQFAEKRIAKEITGCNPNIDPDKEQDPEVLRNKFFWLDIAARFDPVPAGVLDNKIVEQSGVHKDQVKRRRVLNLDNPARDHTYYWQNKRLVIPRITRAINGGTEYPWEEVGISVAKLARHYNAVSWLVLLRILFSAIAAVIIIVPTLIYGLLPTLAILPTILVAVGLYQAIRASKFGDVS
jgi:hypothetical protein